KTLAPVQGRRRGCHGPGREVGERAECRWRGSRRNRDAHGLLIDSLVAAGKVGIDRVGNVISVRFYRQGELAVVSEQLRRGYRQVDGPLDVDHRPRRYRRNGNIANDDVRPSAWRDPRWRQHDRFPRRGGGTISFVTDLGGHAD